MTSAEITSLRRVYGEVCRGYSEITWRGQTVYVAHLTTFDQTDIDAAQCAAFDEAVARGVKTEAQRLKWLSDNKIWTSTDEIDLSKQRSYVENLEKTYSKAALKLQRDAVMVQLVEARAGLNKLTNRRFRAIDLTAERVAEQKVQYEYIRLSFYHDAALKNRIFTRESLRGLSDRDSDDLLIAYVEVNDRVSGESIRRISVQSFFANQLSLCGEAVHTFFGVPIVDLTLYQSNLLVYGRYYRSVFENHKVPKEIADDPDKVDDHIIRSTNAKNLLANTGVGEGGRVGIVGATGEDFTAMGVRDDTAAMQATVNKGYKDGRAAATDLGCTVK